MKWRKLGRLFDPTAHRLANGGEGFAQAPQALVFEDFVRVYFSTRTKDPHNGKYLSHISYIDFADEFRRLVGIADHTVIGLGALGCYDEHGIFPLNVCRHGDQVLGFISGWSRRLSVCVDTAIGLAVSRDQGNTFQRIGPGPVLCATSQEPFLVGDPFVLRVGEKFHMWYIFGLAWRRRRTEAAPERIYKIGHAVSADAISWEKPEEGRRIVADRLGEEECQALPTVLFLDGCFHMFFCYRCAFDFRENRNCAYRIGYAYSYDLRDWTRNDALAGIDVSPCGWDSDMLCYPNVFAYKGKTYLLYNGNEFGRFGFGLAVLE